MEFLDEHSKCLFYCNGNYFMSLKIVVHRFLLSWCTSWNVFAGPTWFSLFSPFFSFIYVFSWLFLYSFITGLWNLLKTTSPTMFTQCMQIHTQRLALWRGKQLNSEKKQGTWNWLSLWWSRYKVCPHVHEEGGTKVGIRTCPPPHTHTRLTESLDFHNVIT